MEEIEGWLKIVALLVALAGMGGIGGLYYQAGQEEQRDRHLRQDVAELSEAVQGLDEDLGQVRDDMRGIAQAACEALGHESILDDCPL